jgi:hypothetical protein
LNIEVPPLSALQICSPAPVPVDSVDGAGRQAVVIG